MKLTFTFFIPMIFGFTYDSYGQVTVDLTKTEYNLDFGTTTSEVEAGWTRVSQETTGDISWSLTPDSRDRGTGTGVTSMTRDFCFNDSVTVLNHKITNGEWKVIVTLGDRTFAHDSMVVEAEGDTVAYFLSNSSGGFVVASKIVTVSDGELNITLSDGGGGDANWAINGITITQDLTEELTGTLKDKHGEIIRAFPLTFSKNYPGPNKHAQDLNTWWEFKDHHYNAGRLTWTGALRAWIPTYPLWTWAELKVEMDKVVANAVAADMTVIINYHNVGEQQNGRNPNGADYTMAWLEEFWTNVAPWYKDNDHVIYELQNEPAFSLNGYTRSEFKTRFLEIYNMVRTAAPDRQLIVFSTPQHNYTSELMANYENDLDWDYTTVGYHLYGGGTSSNISAAAAQHRVVCTEWDYSVLELSYVAPVDGEKESSQTLEKIGHGWMDWSTHRGPVFSHGILIPDALAKGYEWWEESGTTISWNAPRVDTMYYEGSNVTVKIDATDNGSITKTILYLDGIMVSEDNAAPFEWSGGVLDNMVAGNYVVRVEAYDNAGHVEPSTRTFSVLPGISADLQVLSPIADAFVRNNNTQDATGTRLIAHHAYNETMTRKSYLKFDLSSAQVSSVGSAKLRLYNTGEGDDGFVYLHELLNDTWTETGIAWANSPKNTGILARLREDRGGETEPDLQFSNKNQWMEYDVTLFVNQELAGDDIVSFQISNFHESQERFAPADKTDEVFYFGSRESGFAPQLILAEAGVNDTLPATGVAVSPTAVSLLAGQESKLKVDLIPANAANMSVTWSSSVPEVASVDASGIVTALTKGTTVITVTTVDGGFTATSTIKVFPVNSTVSVVPIAYWPFDETSGGTANDVIGNADAIWQKDISTNLNWVKGIAGNAADLNGGDDDKFIVGSDPLDGASELTISLWVSAKAFANYEGVLTTRNESNTGTNVWGISFENDHVDARWNGTQIDSENDLQVSRWHHVAMTWRDVGERALFLDGDLVKRDTSAVTAYVNGGKWWMGDDICCPSREIRALFDEFAMFDKALTDEEIGIIYVSGLNGTPLADLSVVSVSGVNVNPETLNLVVGLSGDLTATVLPSGATDKTVIWSSDDPLIATVDTEGKVTAVKVGTTMIRATTTDGNFVDASEVTVVAAAIPVTGVTVTPATLTLVEGNTGDLMATVLPSDATDKTITWSSDDPLIASVDTEGKVTAVKVGSTMIKATTTDGAFVGASEVTVETAAIDVASISVAPTTLSIKEGESSTVVATILPETATDKTITWSSEDEAVATVDASGKVTAVKAGSTQIKVTSTSGALTATCEVTVTAQSVTSVGDDKDENLSIYPNPANQQVVVSINLAKSAHVNIEIYSAVGKRVKTTSFGLQGPGRKDFQVDLSEMTSGLHLFQIIVGDTVSTAKVVIE